MKQLLELDENIPSEQCLSNVMKLMERMKLNKKEDIDTLSKIEEELNIYDSGQLIKKIISLNRTNANNH